MFRIKDLLVAATLVLLCISCLHAYWPTDIDGELSLAGGDSTLQLKEPVAMPFPDGSVLVALIAWPPGEYAFNIIDRFGELVFDSPQSLRPGSLQITYNDPIHLVPDMDGGAYVVWSLNAYGDSAIYAQRLDTLGNLLWGNDAVQIFPVYTRDFEVCLNSDGGLLLAATTDDQLSLDVYAQRIDSEGNLLWGDSLGVAVSNNPNYAARYPVITSDGNEGCFIVWEDHRTGGAYGDLYAQHFAADGNRLWDEDMMICGSPWGFKIVSDSLGGFILQAGPMGPNDSNKHFRYDGDGNLLWEQVGLSHYTVDNNDEIIPGEPGYFYLGFKFWYGYWGQRIDVNGNYYWPTNWGAPFAEVIGMGTRPDQDYSFRYPNFYAIYTYYYEHRDTEYLYTNALDTLGNPLAGENGVLIDTSLVSWRRETNVVGTDDGGIICVYRWALFSFYHTVAKRANFDGTLGGPLHLLVDMEPQNPPIQIPPGGGSFQFNIAIEDTYVVEGKFDAWIEATLPNGQDLEILHRDDITIQANSVITRPDMTQAVPANAPAGNYIYHLYVGSYEYDVIWAEDSFEFEKLAGDFISPGNFDDWTLTGFFEVKDSKLSEIDKQCKKQINLSVKPNPFNVEVNIVFELEAEDSIDFTIYDLTGRQVAHIPSEKYSPGRHEINWNGEQHASGIYFLTVKGSSLYKVKKMILIK